MQGYLSELGIDAADSLVVSLVGIPQLLVGACGQLWRLCYSLPSPSAADLGGLSQHAKPSSRAGNTSFEAPHVLQPRVLCCQAASKDTHLQPCSMLCSARC